MSRKYQWSVVGALGVVLLLVALWKPTKTEVPIDASQPQIAAVTSILTHQTCALTVPRTTLGPILFPAQSGAAEFDNAIVSGATGAVANSIITTNNGFEVVRMTTCNMVTEGPSYSLVRVTSGMHSGKFGWLPTTQTRGN